MARTIAEIQQSMITAIRADSNLSALNSTSRTAIWRLFTYIFAVCAWTVETLFDSLKNEINDIIARMKPHTARWYAEKSLAFQFCFNLLPDSDKFNNSNYTLDQIEASKIVKYVAVVEQEKNLRIKVAGEGTDLQPLTDEQLFAFKEYMKRVKDAGVRLQIDSLPPDKLRSRLRIYYDPLILNANGQRLDGTESEPVQKAYRNYLKNLPFNGTFAIAYLVDALQKVEGVVIPHVVDCFATYGTLPFTSVSVTYIPDSGYLRFENKNDLQLEFIPQSKIQ